MEPPGLRGACVESGVAEGWLRLRGRGFVKPGCVPWWFVLGGAAMVGLEEAPS